MAVPAEPRPLPIPQAAAPAIPPSTAPRLLIGCAAIVFALLLLALAVPRTLAALEWARAKPVYDRLQAGDTGIDDATLNDAIARLTRGFAQTSEPHLGVMLAYLHMVNADRTRDRAAAEARLIQAADVARATIRVSPSNLMAWTLLTMALDSRNPRDPATLAALARSIHVAPYDSRMLGYRIALAMRHWGKLDEQSRKLAGGQIRRIGEQNLRYLAEVTRDSFGLPAVQEAMREDPALKARFDAVYLSLPSQ
ncbi:MAG TPA: hypothetical protein VEC14_09520 [Reyranellaceae bacterium]|nr:hypothetical protein [Reyranellaceae bacterium]